MNREKFQRRFLLKVFACLIAAVLLSSCTKNTDTGSGIQSSSISETSSTDKIRSCEGTWYEQSANESVLILKGSKLTYQHGDYSTRTKFVTKKSKGAIEILPDDKYFTLIDITYDPDEDEILAHTMPHTDGDGGYHLLTYKRTEYVAPPPPVYGDRIDNSDPDAAKVISDYTLLNLSFEIYEPWVSYGDMTMEPPQEGQYAYRLDVQEDGSALLSSDFCRTITISSEKVNEIEAFMESGDFASMNGVDVWTEDMPSDTKWFELTVDFADGENLHTKANGSDIPRAFDLYGRQFHQLLFYCFVDAGYNMWNGEFHSVEPMRRFGSGTEAGTAGYSVTSEEVIIEKSGSVHKFTADSKYPVFTCTGASEELAVTLNTLTEKYKALAEADLETMVKEVDALPKSTFRSVDRPLVYSFYTPYYRYEEDELFFQFWIEEGHCNSFGVGEYAYGDYPDWRYILDPKTGKILTVYDFFNDPEALEEMILSGLNEKYNSPDTREKFAGDAYRQALKKALSTPETDGGIGMEVQKDGLTLYMPKILSPSGDYTFVLTLYYDEMQDIMSENYSSIW